MSGIRTKADVEKELLEKTKITLLALIKETNQAINKISKLKEDVDENATSSTHEAVSVIQGMTRDILIISENIDRVRRVLKVPNK